MRASLRVFYNLNDMTMTPPTIVVGDKTSYWRESELFIFDGVAFFLAACRNDGVS